MGGGRFDLVIFDCDGVLVDSGKLETGVVVEMARELGADLSMEQALPLFRGRKMAECIAEVERMIGRAAPETFLGDFRARSAEVFRRELRVVAGVEAVLESLAIPACVASAGPPEKIRLSLDLTGLLERFEGRIFSSYEVGSWKPDPGLFLHAAEALGAPPERCAVVEDSVVGIRAAVSARMTAFGYTGSGSGAGEIADAGGRAFGSMQELPGLLSD